MNNQTISDIVVILLFSVIIFFILKSKYQREYLPFLKKFSNGITKNTELVKENEYVELIGTVKHAGIPLLSPLSKRECVYYKVSVDQKILGIKNNFLEEEKFNDFF